MKKNSRWMVSIMYGAGPHFITCSKITSLDSALKLAEAELKFRLRKWTGRGAKPHAYVWKLVGGMKGGPNEQVQGE